MTVAPGELEARVRGRDVERRAYTAPIPVARAALRATEHFRVLAGGGAANAWVRREADRLADAMAAAMVDAMRDAIRQGIAP